MSKDMMPSFALFQPTDLATALSLLGKYEDGWKMAGGQDSLDWFKDRAKRPSAVIDLNGIQEMKGIKETADGIEIGALTPLVEVANNPMIKEKFGLLATCRVARRQPADPQCRHDRRQCQPGRPLLVLPLGPQLLPGRRHDLLCRHAAGHEPRALPVRGVALRRRLAVGHRALHGRARRHDGGAAMPRASAPSRPTISSSARRPISGA